MHVVKFKIDDKIYHNIMFMLKNLKVKGLEIEDEDEQKPAKNTKEQVQKLFASKKIEAFTKIDDPMQWQKAQRDEW